MATIKLLPAGTTDNDGTIHFLSSTSLDLVRYFHKDNLEAVLSQKGNSLGGQLLPAFLNITKPDDDFDGFKDEVYVMASVVETDENGNPTKRLNGPGDILSISCRPFQQKIGEYKLVIV